MLQNLISGLLNSDVHEQFGCLFAVSVHGKCASEKRYTFPRTPCENTGKVGIPQGFVKSAFNQQQFIIKNPLAVKKLNYRGRIYKCKTNDNKLTTNNYNNNNIIIN